MFRKTSSHGIALMLGLVLLAGCQQGQARLVQKPPPEDPVQLNKAQRADIQVSMARGLENQGELDKAAHIYEEVLAQSPNSADACVRLAILADKQGRFAVSAQWHRKALELQPNNADCHCNLGYSYYLQEEWAPAEQALRQALRLKPEHARAANNLGLVLARTGRVDEALSQFRQAGCSAADAHLNLAHGLTLAGALPQAQSHYQLALKQDPQSAGATQGLENLQAFAARARLPQQDVVTPAQADESTSAPEPEVR